MITGDPFAVLRVYFELADDGDGLMTTCKRCGRKEHYSPAYDPSVVLLDCNTHRVLCRGKPSPPAPPAA